MQKHIYEKYIKGFSITNASMLGKGMMAFFLQKTQSTEQPPEPTESLASRVVLYTPDIRKEDDGFSYYQWENGIKNGYLHLDKNIVLAETFGTVWESRTDDKWHKITTKSQEIGHWITGLKKIGNTLFACGNRRKIYRRDGFKNWVDLVDYKTHAYVYADIYEREKKGIKHFEYPMGLTCFDGFNEKDIYAGGTNGSFWRYNGDEWLRVDLPSNRDIADIVCADKQKVYVILADGKILIGREDQWQALESEVDKNYGFAAGATSAAWFDKRLYIATGFDLYQLEDKQLSKYTFPETGHKQSSFGRVTASEDGLLSYGEGQALVFDGERWKEIINQPVFSQS